MAHVDGESNELSADTARTIAQLTSQRWKMEVRPYVSVIFTRFHVVFTNENGMALAGYGDTINEAIADMRKNLILEHSKWAYEGAADD